MAAFTRPNDTTPYAASGDLVANSTTAGSVTPMTFNGATPLRQAYIVRRVRFQKSTTTTTNASFRLHLYTALPTVTNGDNAAWVSPGSNYVGSLDVTVDKVFSDVSVGYGVPVAGSEIIVQPGDGTGLYGLVEARAAYAPGAQEVFTITLETLPT